MNSVGKTMSGVTGRLRTRPNEQRAGYAFCADDNFWFRPAYTEGRCPLCGKVAPGGAPPARRFARMERSWLGMAGLALESLVMLILVLFMYFRG